MPAFERLLRVPENGWLYGLLLSTQTAGTLVMYWKGLPLYRELASAPTLYPVRGNTHGWSLIAILLIQVGFWLNYRFSPAVPRLRHAFVAYLVLFVARLSFTLATAIFSFVFISERLASQMTGAGYALTTVGLFSLFLYMQELQRLGTALLPRR